MISPGPWDDLTKFNIVPDIDAEVFGFLDGVLVEAPTQHLHLDPTGDVTIQDTLFLQTGNNSTHHYTVGSELKKLMQQRRNFNTIAMESLLY